MRKLQSNKENSARLKAGRRQTVFLGTALSAALLAAPLGGCKSDPPIGCSPTAVTNLPAGALSGMRDVRLLRAGETFVLVGLEEKSIRWGQVDEAGTKISNETMLVLPKVDAGPWIALTGKNAPGDQLLVVFGVKRPGKPSEPDYVELQTITQDAGGAASEPRRLLDMPAVPDGVAKLRVALTTSKSGRRAAMTYGFDDAGSQTVLPRFLVMKPDGEPGFDLANVPLLPKPKSGQRSRTPSRWDCLSFAPSRQEFSAHLVFRGEGLKPSWFIIEYGEDGAQRFSVEMEPETAEMGCPTVTATPKGYALAYQTRDGTYFADYKALPPTDRGDGAAAAVSGDAGTGETQSFYSRIIKGSVRWGGPAKQPPVASMAVMDRDYAITYEVPDGPLVERFNAFGDPKGSGLRLPVDGTPGPLSAWPTKDAFYVTYADLDGDKVRRRLFIKVSCASDI